MNLIEADQFPGFSPAVPFPGLLISQPAAGTCWDPIASFGDLDASGSPMGLWRRSCHTVHELDHACAYPPLVHFMPQ